MAQEKTLAFTDFSRVQMKKVLQPQKPSNAEIKKIKTFTALSTTNASNRASDAYPYGDWIYSAMEGENPHVANSLSEFTLEEANVQDPDDGTVYNVKVNNLGGYVFSMYGRYDAEAHTLTIPSWQVVYNHSTEGDCAIAGYTGEQYDDNIILEEDENGNFTMTNDGWNIIIVNEESAYYGYYILENSETEFYKPNAMCSFMAPSNSGYKEISGTAYVEDYGEQLLVYGMFSYAGDASITAIDMQENGIALIASDQQVDSEDQSDYVKENYGADGDFSYLRFVPWLVKTDEKDDDGEYIYDYATVEDIDGALAYAYHNPLPCLINNDKTSLYSPYLFTFATAYVAGVGALNYGEFYDLTLTLTEGTFNINVTAINEVNTVKKTAAAKTYNMMGQEVGKDAKGLLIRDGKKFVVK